MNVTLSPGTVIDNLVMSINSELNRRGWSLIQLSDISEVPYDSLKKLVSGNIENPHLYNILKISNALEIDINSMVGMQLESTSLSRQSRISNMIRYITKFEKSLQLSNKSGKKKMIPLYIAQTPHPETPNYMDFLSISTLDASKYSERFKDRMAFGVKIASNNYTPLFFPNDILLIATDRAPISGEIGLFQHNGDMFLRRYVKTDRIKLESVNELGETIELDTFKGWTIYGYVLCLYR